jgi:hypothetical protein
MITLSLLIGCTDSAPAAPAPIAASQDTAVIESDMSTPAASAGTPASCEAVEYPDRFEVTGDGWGWVDGTCWIDPAWPRQPCPEVHLGLPPGRGGDPCQTRSDCPADGDDGHWFCAAGACRRFEEEWLTLCVNEAWVLGGREWTDGRRIRSSAIPSFSGVITYSGDIDDGAGTTGYSYHGRTYQPAVAVPYTEGCRSVARHCDLIAPTFFPENVSVSLSISWMVWEDNLNNDSCSVPSHLPDYSRYDISLTELAQVVNQGCIGLSSRNVYEAERFADLCVNKTGARISLWYP